MESEIKDILLVKPLRLNTATQMYPPIGLGFLSSYLKKKGCSVEILDCDVKNISPQQFLRFVNLDQYRVIGFRLFTSDMDRTKKYLDLIKKSRNEIITVVGGPQVGSDPIDTLKYLQNADYGVYGEGESCMVEFLNALRNGDLGKPKIMMNIPNLVWKSNGEYLLTPTKFEPDLDEIGDPDWDEINPSCYGSAVHGFFSKKLPTCPIIVTRGCPYKCTFCGSREITGYKVRSRDPDKVIKEIKYLKYHYGIQEFQIVDDNFTANRENVIRFCKALIDEKIDMPWNCPNGTRLDTLTDEMLKIMKESGCYEISVGIESGNQKILDSMKKGLTLQTIREKTDLINKHNINVVGFIMVGYPLETTDTIEDSRKLALELPLKRVSLTRFSPFPGIPITEELIRKGEINKESMDYSKLSYMSWSYVPEELTKMKLRWLFLKFFITFYSRPHIIFHNIKGIHSFKHFKLILRKVINFVFGI